MEKKALIRKPPAGSCRAPLRAESDERWRCLFEHSEDAQVLCDRKGTIQEANPKAIQLLGLKEGLERSADILQYVTAAAAQKLADSLKRSQGRQETFSGITLLSGGRLSLLADIQTLPLKDGCSLVTFKDASRRWRLESHMQRLITAVDSTSDVIFLTDSEFRIAFVNAAFQIATGYTIEDTLGRPANFLRTAASAPAIEEYLAKVIDGTGWKGELVNRRVDGTEYPVEATISPIYDHHGNRLGYAAFERDLSVRKQLEQDLRLERNHVLSIINSLDSAVYTMDHRFRLSHMNDGWKKMPPRHGWLNMSTAPEAGRSLLRYVEDRIKRAQLKSIFRSVLREGRPQEIQAASPDGHYWAIKVAPWHHENEPNGLIYVVTDQTKFHDLERQLYQAQKMETIGALAAGVAHDFNNLLQAIRGNVSLLLLHQDMPAPLLHQVEQIDQAAGRAAEITQQLLSFSRVSEEKVSVLDFNQVIQEASQLIRRSLLSKIQLVLKPADKPLRVKMDSTRAQQLLLNLCINSQDAMPQGGQLVIGNALVKLSSIQAAKAHSDPGAEFARCTVTDTGTGIPADVLNRMFDPFFTTKEKGKGTGLGLAIVQSVVAQANGFIEVETCVGKGTSFHIYLPRVETSATVKGKVPAGKLVKGTGRIMVVDDVDLVLDFTRTFLSTMGYDVLVANSADEALRILAGLETPVDLVFTDFNMPGMNGRELIQEAGSRWPSMKFILSSGYLEDHERQELTKDPRVNILDKPFNMRDAGDLITRAITKQRPGPKAP